MEIITLREDYIKLGQALKAAALVEDGVEAKLVIKDGEVTVNGEVDTRRGRKLYDGCCSDVEYHFEKGCICKASGHQGQVRKNSPEGAQSALLAFHQVHDILHFKISDTARKYVDADRKNQGCGESEVA